MSTEIIGRYEIKNEIARGGMATVFRAYDPRFERDIAIKILPQAFLHDPQFRVRFEREAKMIALLEHPAIVPVYDFGEENGQPYIVMRYMSGGSLTERLQQVSLSLEETSQMITRIAPGLDAAHARDIIHRDLKPGNILFDQYGNAYLSDFGIARLAAASSATLTGAAILGTPAYMSPEQVQGEKTIDGRSDLYALGILVFQMLTGEVPYQADTPAKVMMSHVLQPIPNIQETKRDLPDECKDLITKAMAKNPNDRYSTAIEFASELESVVLGKALTSTSTPKETIIMGAAAADSAIPNEASPDNTAISTQPATLLGRLIPGTAPAARKVGERPRSRTAMVIIALLALLFIVVVAVGFMASLGRRGSGPLAFLAPPSNVPTTTFTLTALPPTATQKISQGQGSGGGNNTPMTSSANITDTPTPLPPSETPTSTPSRLVIGGADKIAYLNGNDIYTANLDGSDLLRMSEDGAVKINLQWTPDGQAVKYISGKCVYAVRLEDTRNDLIACFNFAEYVKAFEISPDGKQVALSLDNQLYIIPYDLDKIAQIQVRSDVTELAACKEFAPLEKPFVKFPRWSRDGTQLAMVIFGVASGIGTADTIQVINIDQCTDTPKIVDNFPPPRFRPEEYAANPLIQNFGWDGFNLFSLVSVNRNDGFGNLHIYNMDLFKANMNVNPIEDSCCYRDPIWSPDSSHVLFAFQKFPDPKDVNTITFYMVPYGSLGTGLAYEPLQIPPLTLNHREHPQPALRPAQ